MKKTKIIKLAIKSLCLFPLLAFNYLSLRKDRIGNVYNIKQADQYAVFRETVNKTSIKEMPVVLVVGFRLKFISSNPFLHWLFQRICILTTPFWSGFRGFGIKLWMVDPESKNYFGIYEWLGEQNARTYVDFLTPILYFFSVKNSVWHKFYPDTKIGDYLSFCAVR